MELGLEFSIRPDPPELKLFLPHQDPIRLALSFYSSIDLDSLSQLYKSGVNDLSSSTYRGIVVRQLDLKLLEECKKLGVFVFDLHGNAFVRLPGVLIERFRPAPSMARLPTGGTSFSAKASRLIRALLVLYPKRWTQTELAEKTGLSRGYISIHIARLKNAGYLSVHGRQITLELPDRLLDDWVAHYRFDRHQRQYFAISMNTYDQGLEKLARQLDQADIKYAFTGWSGAHLRRPFAIPQTLMAYVNHIPGKLESLFSVQGEGNVVLIEPHDPGVFQFTVSTPGGQVVSDVQLYLDLCKMPGRAREQAETLRNKLLDFRKMNDAAG